MSGFVTMKAGNMRKPAEFIIYPFNAGTETVTIQSDRRIARINLSTGETMLSSGKGGDYCNTFLHLSPIMGAVQIDCPADVLEELRRLTAFVTPGPVSVSGLG